MIANFFQSLRQSETEYLLVSGQAAVLYGAATFSEDIDLWINPTESNRDRFVAAARDCHARYHKLTPALTVENLLRGHGFHFILPDGASDGAFLDVMGRPPRVGSFADALSTSRWMETEWGAIRTVGIKPLVELKKTQRLGDYPVIGKLALAWFDQPESAGTASELHWALQNIFTLPELAEFFTEHPAGVEVAAGQLAAEVAEFGRQLLAAGEAAESVERGVGAFFLGRIAELQRADRLYWREIIADLKILRAAGELMPEGRLVSPSLE